MLQQCKVDGGLPGSFPKEALACGTGKPRLTSSHCMGNRWRWEFFRGLCEDVVYEGFPLLHTQRQSILHDIFHIFFFFPLPPFLHSFPLFFPYPLLLFFPFCFPSLCFLWKGNHLNLFWTESICITSWILEENARVELKARSSVPPMVVTRSQCTQLFSSQWHIQRLEINTNGCGRRWILIALSKS